MYYLMIELCDFVRNMIHLTIGYDMLDNILIISYPVINTIIIGFKDGMKTRYYLTSIVMKI